MFDVELKVPGFGAHAVVALHGDLDLAGTPAVESHLIAAVAACGPSVVVDLAGLEGIGYSGLSVLLRVQKWTRRSGGDLPLAAPQQPVRRILEATGLIDVFAVYHSVEEAANSARQAAVAGGAAAAPCGHGHPVGRPAVGIPHFQSFAGPAVAGARNVPAAARDA